MERDIKSIVSQMTLEEKAGLCSGLDFWHTKPIERLGVPSIMVTDGPHGLRKQDEAADHLGLNNSVPATCFPSGAGLACSWDRELLQKVGEALGEECQAEGVSVLLGPAANIKRSPLCGRNFEYFSEDPYLSSEMAANHIKGVQSKGVGTSLKHFAANNQEHRRMTIDTLVDERTLREIYLASFEGAVKQSQPWTVMCAYNKINGEYCSENKYILTDILKEEWGHEGFVMSDWGAVNRRAAGLEAGLELEMPGSNGIGDRKIVEAVRSGRLPESILDSAVERLLKIIFKAIDNKKENVTYDREAHHALARKVAEECIVLLKNEDGVLPVSKKASVAVIGAFAKELRYQGGGSSHINPTKLEAAYAEIERAAGAEGAVRYAAGYSLETDDIDEGLINEARQAASQTETAVIFAGLPDRYESEGYDRAHMRIPENHIRLIEAVAEVQKNIVVVLCNGSPVEMPWIGKVKGVLECYLGGQALGGAVAAILYGDANPCGKLAETFPVKLEYNPSQLNFPGERDKVEYREGIFVGYRYYDAKGIEPLFPFGYGLSYTDFEYSGIKLDKPEINDNETLNVSVRIKNTGKRKGKEIVQLYIKALDSCVIRPEKELKGFEKVELLPGEEKAVSFSLDKRAFAYYNVEIKDWHVETGAYEILVGKSAESLELKETVKVNSTRVIKKKYHLNTTMGDLMTDPAAKGLVEELTGKLTGEGGIFSAMKDTPEFLEAILRYSPLRALVNFSQGTIDESDIEEMLKSLNEN